jgi:hypothetical protein
MLIILPCIKGIDTREEQSQYRYNVKYIIIEKKACMKGKGWILNKGISKAYKQCILKDSE